MHTDAQILIVDDIEENVELLMAILDEAGFEHIRGITDPRQIYNELDSNTPDLILLDIRMPHLNGYDILSYLQTRFGVLSPPVLVLTAQNDDETRKKAVGHGALNFLTKPFDQSEVLSRINNILKVHFVSKESREESLALKAIVSDRTKALKKLSVEDPHTGLPNRRALRNQVTEWVSTNSTLHAFFIVIDDTQAISSIHGYNRLEKLIFQIAQLLEQRFSDNECYFLSCWGGHEFILLSTDKINPEKTANSITNLIGGMHMVDQVRLYLSARVGIASWQESSQHAYELIDQAALALPSTSAADNFRFYTPELKQEIEYKAKLMDELKFAANGTGFKLVLQPKLRLSDSKITSAEALLRFTSESFGQVSPGIFIPLAEQSGCIIEIGNWVLEESLKICRDWLSQGLIDKHFSIAVNVASEQLIQTDFAVHLLSRLKEYDLPTSVVQLEVTESSLMENMQKGINQIAILAEHGVKTAIDDFGTGYSSLAYLRKLPVSILKIDRSFIEHIDSKEQDRQLASTVVAMANNFNLDVVAEGIETDAQLELVKAIGCDYAQGFLISKPVDKNSFAKLLQPAHTGESVS